MDRVFSFPRPRPRGLLGRRFEMDEQLVLLGGIVLSVGLLGTLPGLFLKIAGCLGAAGTCIWVTFVPYKGRTFLRWYEIRRTYRRLLRDGKLLYTSTAPLAGRRRDGTPHPVAQPVGVPDSLEWITARTAYGDIAVLLQPTEGMFVACIEVEGAKNFGGLDGADKEALISAYEYLLKETAESGGRIEYVQWLARLLPTDPNAHAHDAAARRDPAAPSWLSDSYDQLVDTVSVYAEDRRLFLVLGIPYTQELSAEALTHKTLHDGYGEVLGKEIEQFIRGLGGAQLRWVRNLDEPALASLIHHAYAPDHWIADTRGMDRASCWPAEMDAREPTRMAARSWEGADPWYTSTAWIKQFPVLPVGINFMAPLLLYVSDVILTVGVTMRLLPADKALEDAMADVTNEAGQADNHPGKITDPREERELGASTSTMHDLANGAAGVRLTGWVTVTAPDPELLVQHRNTVRAAAVKSQLALEWCDSEQYRAFTNTLPMVTGLLKD
ncbi:SCO6880 family protein [Streptomyces solaniscabiei]|uniref:SCO6880 family protein n=1 Tax=Streptomyces solaniscabiei TaxID=2683255 RepID=UPI001CE2CDFF|nr:SCO6880 family protein [Streptomyces solaniscabiei]